MQRCGVPRAWTFPNLIRKLEPCEIAGADGYCPGRYERPRRPRRSPAGGSRRCARASALRGRWSPPTFGMRAPRAGPWPLPTRGRGERADHSPLLGRAGEGGTLNAGRSVASAPCNACRDSLPTPDPSPLGERGRGAAYLGGALPPGRTASRVDPSRRASACAGRGCARPTAPARARVDVGAARGGGGFLRRRGRAVRHGAIGAGAHVVERPSADARGRLRVGRLHRLVGLGDAGDPLPLVGRGLGGGILIPAADRGAQPSRSQRRPGFPHPPSRRRLTSSRSRAPSRTRGRPPPRACASPGPR